MIFFQNSNYRICKALFKSVIIVPEDYMQNKYDSLMYFVFQEFSSKGIKYVKLNCVGKEIPNEHIVQK